MEVGKDLNSSLSLGCFVLFFRGRVEAAQDIAGRYPLAIHWDPNEPKLLICEAKLSEFSDRPVNKKSSLLMTMHDSPVSLL